MARNIALDLVAIPAGFSNASARDVAGALAVSGVVAGFMAGPLSVDAQVQLELHRRLGPSEGRLVVWTVLGDGLIFGTLGALALSTLVGGWLAGLPDLVELVALGLEAFAVGQAFHLGFKLLLGREGPADGDGLGVVYGPSRGPSLFPAGTPSGHATTLYALMGVAATWFDRPWLGEALHRASIALLRRADGWSPGLRLVGSVLLDPVGAFNRWLTEGRYDLADHDDDAPLLARLSLGLNALGRVTTADALDFPAVTLGEEVHLGATLRSGLPGHRGFTPTHPFDHFDVQLEVSLSREPFARLFVSGLLAGAGFGAGPRVRGVWGLFGGYDFSNPPVLRVSTVSAGPGLAFAADLSYSYQLQLIGVVSGVTWGAAGALPAEVQPARSYHIGPGAQAWLELQLINRRAGLVRGTMRQYLVTGGYDGPGLEWILSVSLGVAVELTRHVELTVDGVLTERHTSPGGAPQQLSQRATQARVGITWVTDPAHGATPRAP